MRRETADGRHASVSSLFYLAPLCLARLAACSSYPRQYQFQTRDYSRIGGEKCNIYAKNGCISIQLIPLVVGARVLRCAVTESAVCDYLCAVVRDSIALGIRGLSVQRSSFGLWL